MNIRTFVRLIQLGICVVIILHILLYTKSLDLSDTPQTSVTPVKIINKAIIESSPKRAPIVFKCNKNYSVAFTFDDGPHPTHTPLVVKTLNLHRVSAGFFLLGTSIQSFLSARNNLSVHQYERPRIGYLLLQDYSLIEDLFVQHDIYLHGWLHEKINEMRLQTVVDNISTQLIEIGLLKGFKPVYRAPWGIGTAPGTINNKAILSQILDQIGLIPAHWTIDSKDYLIQVDEYNLTNNILKMICRTKGGLILMHDNRPTTANFLDVIIRSIRASGHSIVRPSEINRQWNNETLINRTRRYTEFLRHRIETIQSSPAKRQANTLFRPVEISLPTGKRQNNILQSIDANARYKGIIKVLPNINDFELNANNTKLLIKTASKLK
ncbi:unnamed protein product [Rotaria magnacalcarata]|uniref:NodB homology domain-containing protein n=1 Tax=Rotaria magnacalcarata TaxID=392030 RepID=A0A815XTK2_9BILA|nr:unnamed protein product [Rotaria magnacalcarata]CAF4966679.1 unnamed protein product [Rotaria magnacalcarata]